jgi:hypothetical protein
MFTSTDDMSTPVTRGELRDELQQLEVRLDEKLEQKLDEKLEQKLAHLVTRTEFEMWGGALLARIESGEQRMFARIELGEQRMFAEFARHTKALQESMAAQISAIDDKYRDLPGRVSQLEAAAFPSKRR